MNGFRIFGFVTLDGVLIAGAGETTADALGQLVDTLDMEQAEVAIVAGLEKIRKLAQEVSSGSPHHGAPDPADGGIGGEGDRFEGPERGSESMGGSADDPPAGEAPGVGAGEGLAPSQESCTVCGAAVTPALAGLTREERGMVLCRNCMID